MPLNESKDEVNTSDWDQTIAPIKPPQKVMFKFKPSSGEGQYIISKPTKADHVFNVHYDNKKHKFKGLPKEFEEYLPAFTREEIKEDPQAVLQSIQQTINRKDNATPAVVVEQQKMLTEDEFQDRLNSLAVFLQDDPSKHYEIVKKIGYGGFARVFLVKRKDNNEQRALKFIEPKNSKERQIIRNELGVMKMCQDSDAVIRCYEAFDYR